jgi:hypothetical protein
MLTGPRHLLGRLTLLGRELFVFQQLGEAKHGVERRTQLVADPREELTRGRADRIGPRTLGLGLSQHLLLSRAPGGGRGTDCGHGYEREQEQELLRGPPEMVGP